MKWSWRLGQFAGIGVYVHATFLILVGWVALTHWMDGENVSHVVSGVVFILALFTCVLLHEFGHALAARRFGILTRDITLLPIGGLARLERMPDDPQQELVVALAGPAVTVLIAVTLYAWLQATAGWEPVGRLSVSSGSFIERLMMVNVFLAAFNMIPAFPMDGGRVLRALLAMRMDYARATQHAANLGQGLALLFGLLGLLTNPFLIFIAFFVWIGAAQEASHVQMTSALAGIPIGQVMVTDFRTLESGDPLARAVELILRGPHQDFPVVDDDRVVGVLTRNDLVLALSERGQSSRVGDAMQRDFQVADSVEMLDKAFARLQQCRCHTVPVTHDGRLVGLITMDSLGEFLRIQAALHHPRGRIHA